MPFRRRCASPDFVGFVIRATFISHIFSGGIRSPLKSFRQGQAPMSAPTKVRCREITECDLEGIVSLLTKGFRRDQSRAFWVRAIRTLSEHPTPPGLPRYGHLLESEGVPVGVLLLIFSAFPDNGITRIRCNVSSWYVEPAFRAYATLLSAVAARNKDITYVNLTPSPHTWPILEAQGYERFASGVFIAAAALNRSSLPCRILQLNAGSKFHSELTLGEAGLLTNHANYGCLSLVCASGGGTHPFVFGLGRACGVLPFAYLVYCRDISEFVDFAGPLGRWLALRGCPLIVLDANGPVRGLIGRYMDNLPKYFKGQVKPRPGDIAYSERVLFRFWKC